MKLQSCPFRIQSFIPYEWVKSFLFRMSPEESHHCSLRWLRRAYRARLTGPAQSLLGQAVTVAGLQFSNPVGLAAGLDKNGLYIDPLGSLGFGFIEIGTVTPLPQAGNPMPRLFRLKNHKAIINRMGFNNDGVEAMVERLQRRNFTGPVGVNIGKNKRTPQDNAVDDYIISMRRVFAYCDYLTVNISSPNTQGLRDLQGQKALSHFLDRLMEGYAENQQRFGCSPPLFLKVAPDFSRTEIEDIAQLVLEYGVSGLVVSNTTLAREGVQHHIYGHQAGGLSGAPLMRHSTQVLTLFRDCLGPEVPIIGVGGIFSLEDAQEKLDAGANLVQIYTGFIYEGPALVDALVQGFDKKS